MGSRVMQTTRVPDGRAGGIGILAALMGVFLLGGCTGEKAVAPAAPVPEVSVTVVQPQRVVLQSEIPGRTAACLVAEIRPQVNGLIQERLFEEGSEVEAGQKLYQLDDAPFKAAMSNAAANLEAAKSAAKRARAALEASLAAVEQQRAVVELAQINRKRIDTLADDGAVSLSDRDRIVTEAKVADATLRTAEAQVVSNRQAIEAADAGIAQAEAAVESARINLKYTGITAPISGRIGKSNVTVGSLVTAYQPLALTTINQLDPIYVDAPKSYDELLRLMERLGTKDLMRDERVVKEVQLILQDGQAYPHEGTLKFRDVTVDPSTGSVLVRMVFPNPDGILLPGMFVNAVVTEGVNPTGILVAQQAISRNTKGEPLAMLVDKSGKVEQRRVTIDRAIGNQWLVSSGLAAGDSVILEGLQKVRPGAEVKTIPFVEAGKPEAQNPEAGKPEGGKPKAAEPDAGQAQTDKSASTTK